MRTMLSFFMAAMLFTFTAEAKKVVKVIENPVPSVTLKLQMTNGTNGSGVAWHPEHEVYYAVIAGNRNFPLETFSKTFFESK